MRPLLPWRLSDTSPARVARVFKGTAMALLFSSLLACSGSGSKEQLPTDLEDFDATVELDKVWSYGIGGGSDNLYINLVPALTGELIVAADPNGEVVALERDTGDKRWSTELDYDLSGGVGTDGNQVLVGSVQGALISLDLETGAVRWTQQLSGEILSAPQVSNGIIVVQTLNGKVLGLDASSGEQQWIFDASLPVLTLRGSSTPQIFDGRVYVGFANGKIAGLLLQQGQLQWEQRIGISQGRSELERVVDIDGNPLIIDDRLFVASYQGQVVAIDLRSGRPMWAEESSTYVDMAEGYGNLYLSQADGELRAIKQSSGRTVWSLDKLKYRHLSAPVTIGRYIAVADVEGYLHLVQQLDGKIAGRRHIDGDGIRTTLIADDKHIYVLDNDGDLYAFEVRSKS